METAAAMVAAKAMSAAMGDGGFLDNNNSKSDW